MLDRLARRHLAGAALVLAVPFSAGPAAAAETINFVLNWVPGGDHAPVYWAREQGWYEDAGIDLNIEDGDRKSTRLNSSHYS